VVLAKNGQQLIKWEMPKFEEVLDDALVDAADLQRHCLDGKASKFFKDNPLQGIYAMKAKTERLKLDKVMEKVRTYYVAPGALKVCLMFVNKAWSEAQPDFLSDAWIQSISAYKASFPYGGATAMFGKWMEYVQTKAMTTKSWVLEAKVFGDDNMWLIAAPCGAMSIFTVDCSGMDAHVFENFAAMIVAHEQKYAENSINGICYTQMQRQLLPYTSKALVFVGNDLLAVHAFGNLSGQPMTTKVNIYASGAMIVVAREVLARVVVGGAHKLPDGHFAEDFKGRMVDEVYRLTGLVIKLEKVQYQTNINFGDDITDINFLSMNFKYFSGPLGDTGISVCGYLPQMSEPLKLGGTVLFPKRHLKGDDVKQNRAERLRGAALFATHDKDLFAELTKLYVDTCPNVAIETAEDITIMSPIDAVNEFYSTIRRGFPTWEQVVAFWLMSKEKFVEFVRNTDVIHEKTNSDGVDFEFPEAETGQVVGRWNHNEAEHAYDEANEDNDEVEIPRGIVETHAPKAHTAPEALLARAKLREEFRMKRALRVFAADVSKMSVAERVRYDMEREEVVREAERAEEDYNQLLEQSEHDRIAHDYEEYGDYDDERRLGRREYEGQQPRESRPVKTGQSHRGKKETLVFGVD
jgi:hypothetical protein